MVAKQNLQGWKKFGCEEDRDSRNGFQDDKEILLVVRFNLLRVKNKNVRYFDAKLRFALLAKFNLTIYWSTFLQRFFVNKNKTRFNSKPVKSRRTSSRWKNSKRVDQVQLVRKNSWAYQFRFLYWLRSDDCPDDHRRSKSRILQLHKFRHFRHHSDDGLLSDDNDQIRRHWSYRDGFKWVQLKLQLHFVCRWKSWGFYAALYKAPVLRYCQGACFTGAYARNWQARSKLERHNFYSLINFDLQTSFQRIYPARRGTRPYHERYIRWCCSPIWCWLGDNVKTPNFLQIDPLQIPLQRAVVHSSFHYFLPKSIWQARRYFSRAQLYPPISVFK